MSLMEKDVEVFKLLCDAANKMQDYPGNAFIAQRAGYESPESITNSLMRLEMAGYIRREGKQRRPSGIKLLFSGKILRIRYCEEGRFYRKIKKFKAPSPDQNASLNSEMPVPDGLTFMEMAESGGCRYPFGDQEYNFCGKARKERSSYCPEHHALCYISKKDSKPAEPDVRIQTNDAAFEASEESDMEGSL
jgi:hypothetical protein